MAVAPVTPMGPPPGGGIILDGRTGRPDHKPGNRLQGILAQLRPSDAEYVKACIVGAHRDGAIAERERAAAAQREAARTKAYRVRRKRARRTNRKAA